MSAIASVTIVSALLLGLASLEAAGAEQTTGPSRPVLAPESMYGPDLYRMYCATCHGRDGKGSGPAAAALKIPPPDLTSLARRHQGVFPASDVELIIRAGTPMAAHGSREMPVWGPIFHALDPLDARVNARIASLVSYLATLQRR